MSNPSSQLLNEHPNIHTADHANEVSFFSQKINASLSSIRHISLFSPKMLTVKIPLIERIFQLFYFFSSLTFECSEDDACSNRIDEYYYRWNSHAKWALGIRQSHLKLIEKFLGWLILLIFSVYFSHSYRTRILAFISQSERRNRKGIWRRINNDYWNKYCQMCRKNFLHFACLLLTNLTPSFRQGIKMWKTREKRDFYVLFPLNLYSLVCWAFLCCPILRI